MQKVFIWLKEKGEINGGFYVEAPGDKVMIIVDPEKGSIEIFEIEYLDEKKTKARWKTILEMKYPEYLKKKGEFRIESLPVG